jgi:hypothetical protein
MEFRNCPQSFLFQYLWNLKQPTSPVLAKGSMCHIALEKLFHLSPSERTLHVLHNLFRLAWSEHRGKDPYRILFEKHVMTETESSAITNNSTEETSIRSTTSEETTSPVVVDSSIVTDVTTIRDVQAESDWGREGLQLLSNYYEIENPTLVMPPNPIRQEVWVQANLTTNPRLGVTACNDLLSQSLASVDDEVGWQGIDRNNDTPAASIENTISENIHPVDIDNTFHVRGIVDRLDLIRFTAKDPNNDKTFTQLVLRLTDYKSGKAPDLKYNATTNATIIQDSFFQLKIYALLMREKQQQQSHTFAPQRTETTSSMNTKNDETATPTMPLRYLRLFYLTSKSGRAQYIDYDLGSTQEQRDNELQQIHQQLSDVWKQISELVLLQDPTLFVGCDRSFCYCHQCRNRFIPGSLWQPSNNA